MSLVKNGSQQLGLSVRDRIRIFIEERFMAVSGVDRILPHDSLIGKGVIDSTGILEFIEFLEETFHIDIEDEELIPENLDSIDKLVVFLGRKKGLPLQ